MASVVFEWDDENIRHIARHAVTPAEAEYVFRHPHSRTEKSRSSGNPITLGRTRSGRRIVVDWVKVGQNPDIIRVVTAYDETRPEGVR